MMLLSYIVTTGLFLAESAYGLSIADLSWPNGPLHTDGRFIKNSLNQTVVLAGANWPGAADAMIPEGLQFQSIQSIVSKIKSLNLNAIRLTYAIQMIDELQKGGDVTLQDTLNRALGSTNGPKVLAQILKNNPSFTAQTTRLQVYDAIAAECYKQQVYVHLDNHVSKAEWCCGGGDSNSWFGDDDFNVDNWRRGLTYMATHAKNWPAFVSMSLRNELRQSQKNKNSYNWQTWYANIVPAANNISAANPDVLVYLSGLDFDTKMGPVTTGADLGSGKHFAFSDFKGKNKIVFELHNYSNDAKDCDGLKSSMYSNGYNAMDTSSKTTAKNIAPVVLTEFGFNQDKSNANSVYATCHKNNLLSQPGGPGSWFQWVLSGSYYIREGKQDFEETWGLLNHDWSAVRNADAGAYTSDWAKKSLQ